MSRGDGWIERRGSSLRVRWRDGEVTRSRTVANEDEAERLLLTVRQQKRSGRYVAPSSVTVDEWIETCCARWSDRLTARTIANYQRRAATMLGSLGSRRLVDVQPMDAQRWVDRLKASGYAPSTISSAMAMLSASFREAMVLGIVPRNPCQGVRRPTVVQASITTWIEEEVRRVLSAVSGDPLLHALYAVALATGMRPGELRALRWTDVDTARGTIRVARTITRNRENVEVIGTQTKTHKVRSVAIPPQVVTILIWHRARQRERQVASSSWDDLGLVCDRGDGHWWYQSQWARQHALVCLMADVPLITLHSLRHTMATLNLEQGTHPKVISEMLGHSQIQTTIDRYQHVTEALQRVTSDAMGVRLFGETG